MTLLAIKDLNKQYKDKIALDSISTTFEQGKCVALIGPNGAGKTTFIRILAGLLRPTSGLIHFKNHDAESDVRSMIGYLPQHPVFYGWMTGREFLIYVAELSLLSKDEAKKRATHLLEKVGISEAANQRISGYSGGMKQRLGIAQAIIHKPKLLLLDEPVSSLDPIGRRDVLNLMKDLKKEMTILFSTHILTDADQISDELLLLHNGQLIESGSLTVIREKYRTDQIEVSFEGTPDLYQTKIAALPSISKVETFENRLRIESKNITKAREEILSLSVQEQWSLVSFVVMQVSLEDLFMKVVD